MNKKTFKVLSGRSPTLQGCIQKFFQGGANLEWKKEGGRKLTISLCDAQGGGGVLHPTLAML